VTVSVTRLSVANSDQSLGDNFDRQLTFATDETPTAIDVSVPGQSQELDYAWTNQDDLDDADWADGGNNRDIVVEVDVTTSNMNVTLNLQLARVNDAGTVQETNSQELPIDMSSTGAKSVTFSAVVWTAGTDTDRLRVRYRWDNFQHNAQSVSIMAGQSTAETHFEMVKAAAANVETPGVLAILTRRRRQQALRRR
jgi:hypothetical protein